MPLKIPLGGYLLEQKALAIIAASIAALTANQSKAAITSYSEPQISNAKGELIYNRVLKPKLVLKLSIDGTSRIVDQHRSHSSHSSHRSHSSHSSHYSSSSSSNYRRSTSVPYTAPSSTYPTVPVSAPKFYTAPKTNTIPVTTTPSATKISMGVFLRILYKGCKGDDVTRLQKRLLERGYDILVTGYFGDKTEQAVKKFQVSNELEPDGKVDIQTWNTIAK